MIRAVVIIIGCDADNEVHKDQNCKSGLTTVFSVPALVPREHLMEGNKAMQPFFGGLRGFRV